MQNGLDNWSRHRQVGVSGLLPAWPFLSGSMQWYIFKHICNIGFGSSGEDDE